MHHEIPPNPSLEKRGVNGLKAMTLCPIHYCDTDEKIENAHTLYAMAMSALRHPPRQEGQVHRLFFMAMMACDVHAYFPCLR